MFFPEDVYQEKKCRLLGKKTPMTHRAAKTFIVKFMVPRAIFAVSSLVPGRCANPLFIFHTKLGANE